MKVRFEEEAAAELSAAVEWYDHEREGLGIDLLLEVADALEAIGERPMAWPIVPDRAPVRRFVLGRFPYVVYFAVRADHVLVVAFGHTSRRPGYWQSRLRH